MSLRKTRTRKRRKKTKKNELEQLLISLFQKQENKALLPDQIIELLEIDINKRTVIRALHDLVELKKLRIQPNLHDFRSKVYILNEI